MIPIVENPSDLADVWVQALDDASALADAESILSSEELDSATRFRHEAHRRRFVMRRNFLRRVLGQLTGSEPASLRFETSATGKPRLDPTHPSSSVEFSLSHSRELAVVATSLRATVGVDVEFMNREVDCLQLAERYFSSDEAEWIRGLSGDPRSAEFFTRWTRKEALAKGLGTGISKDLLRIDVSDGSRELPPGWSLYDLRLPQGYRGALAVLNPTA